MVAEGSIGSNIRRIEAVTGFDTVLRLRDRGGAPGAARPSVLNVPRRRGGGGRRTRLAELKALEAELKALRQQLPPPAGPSELAAEAPSTASWWPASTACPVTTTATWR